MVNPSLPYRVEGQEIPVRSGSVVDRAMIVWYIVS